MLESLLGNRSAFQAISFLNRYGEGYPAQIAREFETSLSPIQNQLERLEEGGVVQSRYVGRTRLYSFASQRIASLLAELALIGGEEPGLGYEVDQSQINWDED